MAWTAPLTAVSSAALTAAGWNATVRDNLAETATAKASTPSGYFVATGANQIAEREADGAIVLTSQNTTSTEYTDLETFGPSVTVETGPHALVMLHGQMSNSGSGSARMAYEVSGETDISPADNRGVGIFGAASVTVNTGTSVWHFGGLSLNPGTNTFTAKYRVSSGTGTFSSRRIIVVPF